MSLILLVDPVWAGFHLEGARCVFVRVLQVLRAELELTRGKMEEVRALAQELMSTRGENCQATVGPKLEQLNLRFDTVAQRISSGAVGPP